MADVFLQTSCILHHLQKFSSSYTTVDLSFRNHVLQRVKFRYSQFQTPTSYLAYLLHPLFRGLGIQHSVVEIRQKTVAALAPFAKRLGYSGRQIERQTIQAMAFIGATHPGFSTFSEPMFSLTYSVEIDTPLSWWSTLEQATPY